MCSRASFGYGDLRSAFVWGGKYGDLGWETAEEFSSLPMLLLGHFDENSQSSSKTMWVRLREMRSRPYHCRNPRPEPPNAAAW